MQFISLDCFVVVTQLTWTTTTNRSNSVTISVGCNTSTSIGGSVGVIHFSTNVCSTAVLGRLLLHFIINNLVLATVLGVTLQC